MYLLEIASPSVRGAMGVLTTVGCTLGVLLGQFMGLDWIMGELLGSSWCRVNFPPSNILLCLNLEQWSVGYLRTDNPSVGFTFNKSVPFVIFKSVHQVDRTRAFFI